MKRRIAALIRRYGSSVQAVFPDRTEIVRAFLQPVTSRSWQNMDHMIAGSFCTSGRRSWISGARSICILRGAISLCAART